MLIFSSKESDTTEQANSISATEVINDVYNELYIYTVKHNATHTVETQQMVAIVFLKHDFNF